MGNLRQKYTDEEWFELEKLVDERDKKRESEKRKVKKFMQYMEQELIGNSHKGDWETFKNIGQIIDEMEYHSDKLYKAIKKENKDLIKEHIADCANILLFLGNAYELYD